MRRNSFSFIPPSLEILDNGKFFRKPIGWLYFFFAIGFLISPIVLVPSMFWWNKFNQQLVDCQNNLQVVLLPEYTKIQYSKDTLSRAIERYGMEMNNSIDYEIKAYKQADLYREYTSFGAEYKKLYLNALDVKRQWDSVYNDALNRWERASIEYDIITAKYEKAKQNYDQAESDFKATEEKIDLFKQVKSIFKSEQSTGGNRTLAMILFSFMFFLVGIFNAFLWWTRLRTFNSLTRVHHKFVATPIATHFFQTLGESIGLTVALWGFFSAVIFFSCHVKIGQFGLNFTNLGPISILLPIVLGYLILFVFRILSELLKAVVILTRNTD